VVPAVHPWAKSIPRSIPKVYPKVYPNSAGERGWAAGTTGIELKSIEVEPKQQITTKTNKPKFNRYQQISTNINRYQQIATKLNNINKKTNKYKLKSQQISTNIKQNQQLLIKTNKYQINKYH
jgi:hypothetical protein